SEKAFADIYSTAVSVQNFLPRMSQRLLITVVSALATGLALVLNLGNYQNFLYLLGSFFVPLFGVLVADWLTERAHYTPEHVFNDTEWRTGALVAWLVGFGLYQWLSPVGPAWWTRLVEHTHPQSVSFTASVPSFAAAFALTLVLQSVFGVGRRRRRSVARGRAPPRPHRVGVRRAAPARRDRRRVGRARTARAAGRARNRARAGGRAIAAGRELRPRRAAARRDAEARRRRGRG